ncbi:MAG TPA: M50 family metallopeptidase [Anaerolineaceae bacterium]|nr:M50 family metallopeptidase [Anaerolineaceae bacterium]HPN52445.1 M50 family metallopeptidase [Anaerolineaceae bacterium]
MKLPSIVQRILVALLAAYWLIAIYTFLHESGHALMAAAFGGKLIELNTDFFSMGAHYSGTGDFTLFQSILISVAGVSLPWLTWVAAMLALPRQTSPLASALKALSAGALAGSLAAWVVLPIAASAGADISDDSVNFLTRTGWPPLAESGLFLLVLLFTLWLAWRMIDFKALIHALRSEPAAFEVLPNRQTLIFLAGSLVLASLVTLSVNNMGASTAAALPTPTAQPLPAGYTLHESWDLADQEDDSVSMIWNFKQSVNFGALVRLKNVDLDLLDVRLLGADGQEWPIFHAEKYRADADQAVFEQTLPAGVYHLEIRCSRSRTPGTMELYLKK